MIGGGNQKILGKLPTLPTFFLFFLLVGILLIPILAGAADIVPLQGQDEESCDSIPLEGQDKEGMTLLEYSLNILLIIGVILIWMASVHVFNKYVI
ncbi:MAG: hypothetical protein JSV09_10915 [Thermoplasmata archaeon]|nr:MAG: hypothetical protein JSV09_10915 [Thermoplasmata archaeon]